MGLFDLFKPIWKTKNWKKEDKAVDAVMKITDQAKLLLIAQNAPMSDVRKAAVLSAVKNISDQNILADIAKGNWFYRVYGADYICVMAVKKITDQSLLKDIAINSTSSNIRWEANERLKYIAVELADQSTLADIAKNNDDYFVQTAALRKLYDQKMLLDVVKNGKGNSVRCMAFKHLTDKALAREIIRDIAKKGDAEACVLIGGHNFDSKCQCTICQNVIHDNKVEDHGRSTYYECRRCGRSYKTYDDNW